MIVHRYLYILALSVFTAFLAACGANPDNSKINANPNSGTDSSTAQVSHSYGNIFRDSIPRPTGYVNDYEQIFTYAEEQRLDSLISDFEKRTTIQIAVVTLDITMTTRDSLDALTLKIAKAWGVGQKGKDNGVVIGISRGLRQMRIQNAYGIEKILSDEETKVIIDTAFIPSYREAKYFEGTFAGLKALMKVLGERYK